MSLYHIKNRAYDRMENVYLCVEKIVNISYQFFFSKAKNVQKSLCFLKIQVVSLYVLTCCFIRLRRLEVQEALSFRNRHYDNGTELSKFIWHLKDNNTDFKIKWSILTSAAAYSNKSKRCNLCLAEKFFIIKAEKSTLLNKRLELAPNAATRSFT